MNLIRWQRPVLTPWANLGRLTDLRDEIDRLFESPLTELTRTSNLLSGWTPALDVFEDKDNFTVKAELPGMKKEDIEISLHQGNLIISGERKLESQVGEGETSRSERFFGRFQRALELPKPVDANKVTATYKDGILAVHLPKTEESKPKQIAVKAD